MSTELLTKLEKERFISLNDRTVCLTFPGDVPSGYSLRQLGFPYQTLNFHYRSSSVFVIFGDLESKRKGIEILENGRVDGNRISLDFTRKCVPVTPEELEESRELDVLAVHGVPFKTRDKEILEKFPRAEMSVEGSSYKGGTVFLRYHNPQHAVQVKFIQIFQFLYRYFIIFLYFVFINVPLDVVLIHEFVFMLRIL